MLDFKLEIHDIAKKEYPPADGWYYIAVKEILNGTWSIKKAYWVSDKKCWQIIKDNGTYFKPVSYWGDEWFTTDIEKGFEKLWMKG